jgi:hypothetical protein
VRKFPNTCQAIFRRVGTIYAVSWNPGLIRCGCASARPTTAALTPSLQETPNRYASKSVTLYRPELSVLVTVNLFVGLTNFPRAAPRGYAHACAVPIGLPFTSRDTRRRIYLMLPKIIDSYFTSKIWDIKERRSKAGKPASVRYRVSHGSCHRRTGSGG